MPLYPTEEIIWDENIVPTEFYSGDGTKFFIRYFICNAFNMNINKFSQQVLNLLVAME